MESKVKHLTVVAAALAAATLTGACAGHVERAPDVTPTGSADPDPVLLVSIDGFHPDYLDPDVTPNLLALAEEGVRAEALVPSFPTKTFPNHYTMATGLRPDHHGLVANNIWDPEMKERYGLADRDAVQNAEWYGGVPVWVTSERAGRPTAPLFWPGSEAPIDGVRPTHWRTYDGGMTHGDRVDWVLDRLEHDGVGFATLYFDAVDVAGHDYGPEAPETRAAAARVDSAIGLLRGGLAERGLGHTEVIVVSDHGMSPLSRDRVFFLDDYIDVE
ncbi:MAG: ectonucleotide pyrophosphatase/phosphodiesterase, partial [Gemmatimonadota bacterium]